MQDDVERIVRALSEAQRAALIGARFLPISGMDHPICLVEYVGEPWPEKLCQFFTLHSDSLTPLGLRVRSALLSSTQGE
jgi:hypothetical protein